MYRGIGSTVVIKIESALIMHKGVAETGGTFPPFRYCVLIDYWTDSTIRHPLTHPSVPSSLITPLHNEFAYDPNNETELNKESSKYAK